MCAVGKNLIRLIDALEILFGGSPLCIGCELVWVIRVAQEVETLLDFVGRSRERYSQNRIKVIVHVQRLAPPIDPALPQPPDQSL